MEISELKLFLSVATTGSFSRAAVLGRLTQSTVSKRIFSLELALGNRLFERNGRGARLTEAGRLLVLHAETLVRDAENLSNALRTELSQPQGTVRLALQASISWPLVRLLYLHLGREFPLIRLQVFEVSNRQVVEMIQEGRVDLGVLSQWGQEELPQAQVLFSTRLLLAAPRGDALASRASVPFAKLAGLPLIISPMPNGARVLIEETAKKLAIELNVVLEVHSVHLVKKLVRDGIGYTVAWRDSISEELNQGDLIASPIVSPSISLQFYLSMSNLRITSGAAGAVAKAIRQLVRSR